MGEVWFGVQVHGSEYWPAMSTTYRDSYDGPEKLLDLFETFLNPIPQKI